jgi:hypothetical protein
MGRELAANRDISVRMVADRSATQFVPTIVGSSSGVAALQR